MGYNSPRDSSFVQLVCEDCQCLSKKGTMKEEPITPDLIKKLVNRYGRNNTPTLDMQFVLICLLGFPGFSE